LILFSLENDLSPEQLVTIKTGTILKLCPHSSIIVKIEQNAVKKIAPRKHESIVNIVLANNQSPLNNFVSMPLSHCHDRLLCGAFP
jgi:hypothetical protein